MLSLPIVARSFSSTTVAAAAAGRGVESLRHQSLRQVFVRRGPHRPNPSLEPSAVRDAGRLRVSNLASQNPHHAAFSSARSCRGFLSLSSARLSKTETPQNTAESKVPESSSAGTQSEALKPEENAA